VVFLLKTRHNMRGLSVIVAGLLFGSRLAFAGCSLVEVPSSGFSDTDGGPSQVAAVSVDCGGEYRIGLDAGAWMAGTRRLHDGKGNFIAYRLWQDGAATKEWGDSGLSVTTYAAPPLIGGSGIASYPLFGTLMGADSAPPGEYQDLVSVILAHPPYTDSERQTANLSLSLRVIGRCSLDVSGIQGFGVWPPSTEPLTGVALGSLTVACSPGVRYAVGVDAGQHYDGRQRRLRKGSDHIPYRLRAANGMELGDQGLNAVAADYVETYPAQALQGDSDGGIESFFIWGDADVTHAPTGTYRDTVRVTVVW
jgi:spore coat protein U-like protein